MPTETINPELAATLDATANANDAAVSNFQSKFTANYGTGAFDWKAILAMLMSLLGGCNIPLTPPNIRSQVQRPLIQARMLLKMWAMGVPTGVRSRVAAAAVKTIRDGSDDEIASWVVAAQEGD